MSIKSALRDLLFCVICHEKHYGNQPPPVAFPPFGALRHHLPPRGIGRATKGKRLYGQARRLTSPDLHILCRMCTVDNKALKGSLFICDSTVSTGYSAPAKWGWQRNWIHRGAPRPANPVTCLPPGKVVAPATKGGSLARQGGCKGFIIRGRLL